MSRRVRLCSVGCLKPVQLHSSDSDTSISTASGSSTSITTLRKYNGSSGCTANNYSSSLHYTGCNSSLYCCTAAVAKVPAAAPPGVCTSSFRRAMGRRNAVTSLRRRLTPVQNLPCISRYQAKVMLRLIADHPPTPP